MVLVILFLFLSPHYQIHRVIRIWNNIKLLDLVWFWFFSVFWTSRNNESCLVIRRYKQNPVAGVGVLLLFIFLFCHSTIRVAMFLNLKQYLVAGLCMVLIFFCIFNLTEQWESPSYQTLKQYEVAGLGMLLILIFLFLSPQYKSRRVIKFETISSCWTWYCTDFFLHF